MIRVWIIQQDNGGLYLTNPSTVKLWPSWSYDYRRAHRYRSLDDAIRDSEKLLKKGNYIVLVPREWEGV